MSPPAAELHAPVIAGNWKMHKGPAASRTFLRDFLPLHRPRDDRSILLFPPAISLTAAIEATQARPDIRFGVQNIHWEAEGAFTGEISASMAADAGAVVALIGHSERRHVFGESDGDVARKTRAALAADLTPMVCVGETLAERRAGRVEEVILRQLDAVLESIEPRTERELAFAYEPVWAIGTGETATPQDASAAHAALRERLRQRVGAARAARIPILYGGSVKPGNAAELLAAPDVDGLLVGGASLEPEAFVAICNA